MNFAAPLPSDSQTRLEIRRAMDGIQPAELSECLFTEANDAYFIFHPQTLCLLDANPTAQRLTGLGRRALLAMNLNDMLESPDTESTKQLLEACDATTFFHSREGYCLKCSSGPPLDVNVSVSRLHGETETFGLLMVRDVTQRRRTEESLREANLRLQAVFNELKQSQDMLVRQERMRALGQMASGAAHDINNLLTPLVSYTDVLLLRTDLAHDARQQLSLISTVVRDVAEVIKRLQLVYSPVRSESEVLDLKDLLYQTRELTRPKWHDEAMKTGCHVVVDVQAEDVPPIQGNSSEIRLALMNLIFNSVESMPHGGQVTVRLYARSNRVCIEISDNGIGMTDMQRKRCFDPFFTTKEHGSGLGLSVCHGIAHGQGGAIEIDSVVDQGTTVRLVLPVSSDAVVAKASGEAAIGSRANRPDLRILYIDDDVHVRNSFDVIARSCGWRVDVAEDGQSGLTMLESTPYDVVITDFGMKGMSGKDVTQSVKKLRSDTAVIVISGWDESVVLDAFDGQNSKPDFLISKPASLDCLEEALAKVQARLERKENSLSP